jgi:Ser/Thr protein kinase RdoA (MazF antagonist)
VVRELDVAAHAWRYGAAVVPPADEVEAVPYHALGHIVTFWRYIPPPEDVDPAEAGRRLRAVHDALADYDGFLPAAGHPDETREMLAAAPPGRNVDLLYEITARAPVIEGQALHGDAHLGNCLGGPAGPLWHDFETACRGPCEYDLAALVASARVFGRRPDARRALAAYGTYDADMLDELIPLYVAWVTASMLSALPRRPELADAIDVRISWLARRGSE